MYELSRQNPGFATVYLDEAGALTISAARADFPQASVQRVRAWVGARFVGTEVHVKRVPYDYVRLEDFHSIVMAGSTLDEELQ